MKIPKQTIAELKEKADILEIVESRLILKRKGKDYFGLCPFHTEKSGSFSVNQDKGIYYCFGCGAKGDAIAFLQNYDKRNFTDVVLELAEKYKVHVPIDEKEREDYEKIVILKRKWYDAMDAATEFYQSQLSQSPSAIAYLRKRKTPEDLIKKFRIGYAPNQWQSLCKQMKEWGFDAELLQELGLIKKRQDGKYFDFLRDRLIIPICDEQGRVIALNGRTLGSDEPKYLHSPETPLFKKSSTLYGLNHAKDSIKTEDKVIVVEGPFDVISLHANGITNAIAALGTAFTYDHLKAISRYTESKTVIFNFDSDKAGIQATHRAIAEIKDLIYCGQANAKVLQLPDGDADSFIWKDIRKYQSLINDCPTWIDWNLQEITKDKKLTDAGQFNVVAKAFIKLLQEISDRVTQSFYLQRCAEILAQGNKDLISIHLSNLARQSRSAIPKNQEIAAPVKSRNNQRLFLAESLLLAVYFHCPDHQEEIETLIEEKDILFHDTDHRELWRSLLSGNHPAPPPLDPIIALDILKPELAIKSAIGVIEEIQKETIRKLEIASLLKN